MQTVLVTGATGFVGRAVCEKLMEDTITVRGTMRGGAPKKLPVGVHAVTIGDIAPDTDWTEALEGVDSVIHLAARVHVMDDRSEDPLASFRLVNVEGTERLARMAAAQGVKRFVFVSSVKVHGEETVVPYSEESAPQPLDPYGVSKWEAEQALGRVAEETGLEVVTLRPPLIYGPEVKANFLRLMGVVERGIPLPLASIDNRRSLLYLGNLVDAIVTAFNHPKAAGQTYLVSDGEDVSTPELVRRVANAFGIPARLIPFPLALMRMAGSLTGKTEAVDRLLGSLVVDSGKVRRELGWKAPFTMQDGLRVTAQWYRRNS